jgi:methyl-accepting chemotaxis protein
VGEGVKLVNDTSDVLTTIADKVAQIDTLIADIAASAQEQSSGLAQVNSSVNHMDQVTQQNAAMVEETTAAAVNLKSEADALSSLVSAFSISSGGALGAAPPRPAVRMAPRAARLATGAAPALKAEADWAEF